MKREDLLNYIGEVDPRFVEELFEEPTVVRKKGRVAAVKWRVIAASLAIVIIASAFLTAGIGGIGFSDVKLGGLSAETGLRLKDYSVVMIDVNPSIQFRVNDRDVVVSCETLNEDARKLSEKLDVVGKKCDDAVEMTLKVLNEAGYVTGVKNSVLITVLDEDEDRAVELQKESESAVKLVDEALDLTVSLLTQVLTDDSEYAELADKYNVSSGKIALIDKICDANKDVEDLSVGKLVGSSIQTINQLLQVLTTPQGVDVIGAVFGAVPKEYLREIGLDGLGVDEIINLVQAAADFFSELTKYYPEEEVADNSGYDLSISRNPKSETGNTWTLTTQGKGSNTHSQGATIDTVDGIADNFVDQPTIDGVLSAIDAIDRIFGSAPDTDTDILTENTTEITATENTEKAA